MHSNGSTCLIFHAFNVSFKGGVVEYPCIAIIATMVVIIYYQHHPSFHHQLIVTIIDVFTLHIIIIIKFIQ